MMKIVVELGHYNRRKKRYLLSWLKAEGYKITYQNKKIYVTMKGDFLKFAEAMGILTRDEVYDFMYHEEVN